MAAGETAAAMQLPSGIANLFYIERRDKQCK